MKVSTIINLGKQIADKTPKTQGYVKERYAELSP